MQYKRNLIHGLSALVLSGALVSSGMTAAFADESDSTTDALDRAPSSDQVINAPSESTSVAVNDGTATLTATNVGKDHAGVTLTLDSGITFEVAARDDTSVGDAETTAQVLSDQSARLLSVYSDPAERLVSEYSTTIPDGWVAQSRADGGFDIVPGELLKSGLEQSGIAGDFVLATIAAPWAIDANGNTVDTSFEWDGKVLRQTVLPDSDTVFPVVADPSVVGHGYFFSIYYGKEETRSMRDMGAVVGFIFAAGAALVALPGGLAMTAAFYTVGAAAVGAIATVAGNASGEGRCLKLDLPSFLPSSVKC